MNTKKSTVDKGGDREGAERFYASFVYARRVFVKAWGRP